ncbi:uncharacterized protein TRAVEDRAFT_30521, partial [Trametes versicolor FP-101664 SS1]|uniref:uncharacterized protein n=1 Tax=Trametes versicolor (strain FP-101664) TaxID=717944 RepID=UPI0004622A06
MKHLRRNRSISVSTPSASASTSTPAVSAPAPLSPPAATKAAHTAAERSRGSHDTPLYARFTTTRRAHDGSGPSLKPLVSGPLALASKRPAQVPVPVPRPIEQQKSSDSRKERERRRDEEKSRAGTPSKNEETKAQPTNVDERKEDPKVETSKSKGADDEDAVKQQVRRMPSDGTALSAGSAGASAAGRHGTRVDGERVLLPARKVTQKRGGASSPFPQDEKYAERSTEREKKSADPPSSPSRDVGGERRKVEEVRAVGERVLLPARKVARKRVDVEGAKDPALESSRIDSDGVKHTSSKGSTPSSSARANVNETSKTRTAAVEQAQAQARARATSPEPQASSSSPVAFPPVPAPSPAGPGVSAAAPAHFAAVVVVRNSGSEGQFSTPKRARMHTLATTTPASRPSPVTSDPRARPEPSKSSERPKPAENELVAPAAPAVPKVAEPSLTSQTTTSSVAAAEGHGAPPRRRKYSLRAAFGLPDPPPSDTKASIAASPSHANTAKPPTPSPQPPLSAPSPPPDRARTPASNPDPPASQETDSSSEAPSGLVDVHSSAAPRDRRAPPIELLQLQSLHLSGFNFSLEALLAADGAEPPPPPPVPPLPAAV